MFTYRRSSSPSIRTKEEVQRGRKRKINPNPESVALADSPLAKLRSSPRFARGKSASSVSVDGPGDRQQGNSKLAKKKVSTTRRKASCEKQASDSGNSNLSPVAEEEDPNSSHDDAVYYLDNLPHSSAHKNWIETPCVRFYSKCQVSSLTNANIIRNAGGPEGYGKPPFKSRPLTCYSIPGGAPAPSDDNAANQPQGEVFGVPRVHHVLAAAITNFQITLEPPGARFSLNMMQKLLFINGILRTLSERFLRHK